MAAVYAAVFQKLTASLLFEPVAVVHAACQLNFCSYLQQQAVRSMFSKAHGVLVLACVAAA
jgi:hypothetical protein